MAATFTFIRHGESTDNVKDVWAGWADATLTVHGMNQARALAESLAPINFHAILCSPLKRAEMTAQEVLKTQSRAPSLIKSPLLKERSFGIAEGKKTARKRDWSLTLTEQCERGVYPSLVGRQEKFPDGESMDDVLARADKAWEQLLWPYVQEATEKDSQVHVAVVSHGLFIKETLRALAKYDSELDLSVPDGQWLRNTGWARVVIRAKDSASWQVELTHFNSCVHLNTVKRQQGGIGRGAFDARQKDIRGFFGGKSRSTSKDESRG
ncbi:hypothetical protein MKEN_00901600 [Mycena kentingensis (nom. inval.)]|nr:hypothetical protein MKEN_00901600 [Mycena kentingensis (nom. inval.)]